MENLLYVSGAVALLALAGLFIYVAVFLNSTKGLIGSLTTSIHGIIEEVKTIRASLQGTIQNLEGVAERAQGTVDRANTTIDRVNGQLNQVEGIISGFVIVSHDVSRITTDAADVVHAARGVVMSVIDLEQDIQLKVQAPIIESLTIFSALAKGIRAFRIKLSSNGVDTRNRADIYT